MEKACFQNHPLIPNNLTALNVHFLHKQICYMNRGTVSDHGL
jgi:hypothetical protein